MKVGSGGTAEVHTVVGYFGPEALAKRLRSVPNASPTRPQRATEAPPKRLPRDRQAVADVAGKKGAVHATG